MSAEEFIKNTINSEKFDGYLHIENLMIEFAKLHVQAALSSASKNVEFDEEALIRASILNSYPLNNIK